MCTRWLALLVFSLGSSALLAQPTPPPPNQEQTMQILLDRIQQLEKRVSELEDHKRKQSAAQTPLHMRCTLNIRPTQRKFERCKCITLRFKSGVLEI